MWHLFVKKTATLPYPVSSSQRRHKSILFKLSFPSRSRKLNFTSINCRRKSFAFLIDWCGNYRLALRHTRDHDKCYISVQFPALRLPKGMLYSEWLLFFWNTIFPRHKIFRSIKINSEGPLCHVEYLLHDKSNEKVLMNTIKLACCSFKRAQL